MFPFLQNASLRVAVLCCLFFWGLCPVAAISADFIMPVPAGKFDERRWKFIVSPYIWAASLDGHLAVAGHRANIALPFANIVRQLDLSLMGNIEITNGQVGAYLDGQYTKTSQRQDYRTVTMNADVTMASVSAGLYYRMLETPLAGETVFGEQQIFALEPTAGVRWTRLQARLYSGPLDVRCKADWVDPFVGMRLHADMTERWNVFAKADIGGFGMGSDLSAQGQVYLGYRTYFLEQPAVIRLGYRALYQDYHEGAGDRSFKWNVTQHGPIAGISFVF